MGMCVKHFVANDSETQRTSYLARVDEQTLREVYLAPFQRLVHDAQVWSVMSAYSGVDDGTTAATMSEHRPLLTGVLKDEWGFDGVVLSDWVATKSVVGAAEGGLDLQMPGPDGPWGDGLLDAVRTGDVSESLLDAKVLRLLRLAQRVGALDGVAPSGAERDRVADVDARGVLRELVSRSMVVLRDDSRALPVAPDDVTRIALLGPQRGAPVRAGRRLRVRPSGPPVHARGSAPGGVRRGRGRRAPRRRVPPAAPVARPGRPLHDARGAPRRARRAARRRRHRAGRRRRHHVARVAAGGPRGPRSRCACARRSGSTSPVGTRWASVPSAGTRSASAARCCRAASTSSAPRSSSTRA